MDKSAELHGTLGGAAARPSLQLVQRGEVGARAGHHRVGIGAAAREGPALDAEAHRHLGLRVGALRDGVDLEQLELRCVGLQRADGGGAGAAGVVRAAQNNRGRASSPVTRVVTQP